MELEFTNICKSYGSKLALNNVNLTLNEGIYGLIGPNGAGKSTLLSILTGNLQASSGEICFNGRNINSMGKEFRSLLGYMPQQQALYPSFSCEDFLYYMASLRGMTSKRANVRIAKLLRLLELEEVKAKPAKALSGGMKQRLLLAQAMLDEPDILVLDEPTAGLDPRQRIAVRNLIASTALHNIVILSTHVVSDVEYAAKELILIQEGQILTQDTPQNLCAAIEGMVWEVEVPEESLEESYKYGLVSSLRRGRSGVMLRMLSRDKPPYCCRPAEPTLEDVYLNAFGDRE